MSKNSCKSVFISVQSRQQRKTKPGCASAQGGDAVRRVKRHTQDTKEDPENIVERERRDAKIAQNGGQTNGNI